VLANVTEIAPAEGPTGGDRKRHAALYSTVDQALSSLSNALLLFALARVTSVGQFGVAALLVAALLTWVGFNRGALGAPILIISDLKSKDILAESGYAMTWAAASGLPAAAVLVVLGMYTHQVALGAVFGIAAPAVLVQDLLRFTAISMRRPGLAAMSDGVWTVSMLALYLANLVGVVLSPELSVMVWAAGAAAAALFLAATTQARPSFRRLLEWWSTYRRPRTGFGVVQALTPTSTALLTFAVTAIAGTVVAGGLRGAIALFGPIVILISALPLIFVPHVRRAAYSPRQQWSLLVKITVVTSCLTLLVTASVPAVPASLGSLALGNTWRLAIAVAPFVGLSIAFNCWTNSVYVLFQAIGLSTASLRLRIFQISAQLGTCIAAAAVFKSTLAIAQALSASAAVTATLGVVVAARTVTRLNPAAAPTAGSGRGHSFRVRDISEAAH